MKTSDLAGVQAELQKLGVKDVKFFFNLDVKSRPNSDVKSDVAYLLDTYLRGDVVEMHAIGDVQPVGAIA
jgi:hypothetical protein